MMIYSSTLLKILVLDHLCAVCRITLHCFDAELLLIGPEYLDHGQWTVSI